ncbi:hypothetical protein QYE76_038601 [Lolium multiflorum]|uniref:F-box domain-containing protein n=1 Tax=Lolium multiflorum TaxID=4521 RepID=A0AAD8T9U3_LOLMU|nr:hypothetical protein QYE76_038601 [Lolium multiflorum]
MAGGQDRLSELPNDLLRRVLHFAPLKEAASTTALSRRWRAPLWLSSGAVNLETGVHNYYYYDGDRHDDSVRFFSTRDAFVSAAAGALDAAAVPVTTLTLRLDSDLNESADVPVWSCRRDKDKVVSRYTGLVGVVLSHRATRRVEELRLVARDWNEHHIFSNTGSERLYTVTLHSLPFKTTLRVLELANCKGLLLCRREAAAPRLSSIRLSHCDQDLCSLQRIIDAAPALLAVRLESVNIDATDQDEAKEATARRRLRCPAATMLVLNSCTWMIDKPGYYYKETVDVDDVDIVAPRLRSFMYKGPLRSLSFSPRPPELEQVDLDLSGHGNYGNKDTNNDIVVTFWQFARSFTSAKEMRLRVNHLEDIAVLNEARRVELLPTFRRLQRLEVQGVNLTKGKTPAVTILNLLRCCPMLSALRINLTPEHHHDASNKNVEPDTRIPQKEIQIAALAPCHLFQCLQSSLRRVGLQFQLEKSNCLGVKLIKFFAENAMALEEMYIDGGEEKFCEQMNPKIDKWNSKRRKSGATSFVILPLKR